MLRRELGIWRRLKHKNIVPFLGIAYGFGMDGTMSLVSLWMPNESGKSFQIPAAVMTLAAPSDSSACAYNRRVICGTPSKEAKAHVVCTGCERDDDFKGPTLGPPHTSLI